MLEGRKLYEENSNRRCMSLHPMSDQPNTPPERRRARRRPAKDTVGTFVLGQIRAIENPDNDTDVFHRIRYAF